MIDPIQAAAWANTIIAWCQGGVNRVPQFVVPISVKQAMLGWLGTIQTFVNGPGWAKEVARLNEQASSS
jgi:hypothetical protein